MSFSLFLSIFLLCLTGLSYGNTSAIEACSKQFVALSQGQVVNVPNIRDLGDKRSYYFHWGPLPPLIQTRTGTSTGTCVIRRDTGEGVVILDKKELGKFSLWD